MVWIDYKNEDIKNNKEMLNLAKEFLQANRNKRLKMVGQLIDAYKNNENMAVLKSEMVKLLNCLETLLREGIDIKENSINDPVEYVINMAEKVSFVMADGKNVRPLTFNFS